MDTEKLSEKAVITINDVKPKDRLNGYPLHVPRWYTKIFEFIPGLITWLFILLPFIAAFTGFPELIVFYITFLTIYWAYRGLRFITGIIIGYERMKRDIEIDWIEKIKKEKLQNENLQYVLIYPVTTEDTDVMEPSLKAWAQSELGGKKITLVVANEQRFSKRSTAIVNRSIKEFKSKFKEVLQYVHPNNINGEVQGVKNPNINWATRLFVEELEKRGERIGDYLLITCDSDQRPHPRYLAAITYKYLTVYNQDRKFFATAIHTFNNNLYRVPVLIRSFSNFLTLAITHEWVLRKKIRETWSAYVVNLQTVVDVGYWDPQISNDDTAFYYNALIRFAGDFSGEEIYVPTYNDAVENQTYYKSHVSLYKQQIRWGWGAIVFPMTFAGLYRNSSIPPKRKFKIALLLLDDRLIFRTVVYLLTFGLPILTLFSPEFQYSSAAYNLPKMMSYILTFVMFFNIPIYIIRKKISPLPKEMGFIRKILDTLETLLVTVNMLTFGFIPYIQALTEMMFKKSIRKEYYATEKVAIKK